MASPSARSAAVPASHLRALPRLRLVLVWVVWLVALVMIGIAVATGVGQVQGDVVSLITAIAGALAAASLVTTGAFLATRLPANPTGWLLWAGGALLAIAFGASADLGLPRSVEVVVLAAANLSYVPAVVLVGLYVPLFFPTGHLPSKAWRKVAILAGIAAALQVVQTAFSPFSSGPAGYENPLAVTGSGAAIVGLIGLVSTIGGVIAFPVAVASLVVRYRRSTGVERPQIRWFAAAAALVGLSFATAIGASTLPGDLAVQVANLAWMLSFVGFALLPVAIAIAILRYRLYDIDVILRRTAVYVPLTAILAGLYAALISVLQKVFVDASGGPSDAAVILSTLTLATVFTPIKSALQSWVDRTFRDSGATARHLAAFVDEVATSLAVPSTERAIRGYFRLALDLTQASGGAAYAGAPGDEHLVAVTPTRRGSAAATILVRASDAAVLGRLELDERRNCRPLRAADLDAVRDMAEHLADALQPIPDLRRTAGATPSLRPLTVTLDD